MHFWERCLLLIAVMRGIRAVRGRRKASEKHTKIEVFIKGGGGILKG